MPGGGETKTARAEHGRGMSLGRALDMLKDAMSRRRVSSSKGGKSTTMARAAQGMASTIQRTDSALDTNTRSAIAGTRASIPHARSSVPPEDSAISADEDAVDDADEQTLLPMTFSRAGIDPDRTRAMFKRHGLPYESRRRSGDEPAPKVRRVERAIKVRLHYRCHECSGHFSKDKACMKCGHQRCVDCVRQPGQRVKETMDSAREARDNDVQSLAPTPAAVTYEPRVVDPSTDELAPSLDHDEHDGDGESTLPKMPGSSRHLSPLGSKQTAHDVPQLCHKCRTPFDSVQQPNCGQCTHLRCNKCTSSPPKAKTRPRATSDDEPSPKLKLRKVTNVQRVYRKTRLRVRYTCDQCSAVFILGNKHQCQACGHGRCNGCSRNP
ncbi:hypothetical protein LTR17_023142 [Elasticomyces elasticus]|nr:hypothetical protein LTR17_023142 [Elasticomyces elasticus]